MRDGRPRVVVVGDVGVDVLVAPSVPPVAGADVPARITTAGGGAGATTAAWLADRGVDVTLVARVGDDAAGRAAVQEVRGAGGRDAVAVDPDAPTATVVVLLGPHGERSTVVVTRGASGACWVDRDGLRSVPAPSVDVVDPMGAGYAFDAGLFAAWLTGADPQAALRAGCAAGAEAVSRRGGRPGARERG